MNERFYPRSAVAFVTYPERTGTYLAIVHPTRGMECPGGKLENGETAAEAVVRETLEESGAIVLAIRELHTSVIGPSDRTGLMYRCTGILCEMVSPPLGLAEYKTAAWRIRDMPTAHERVGYFYSSCVEAL